MAAEPGRGPRDGAGVAGGAPQPTRRAGVECQLTGSRRGGRCANTPSWQRSCRCRRGTAERDVDPQILRWLAFARQKTAEIVTLAKGLTLGTDAITGELAANRADLASRANSPITRDPAVRARAAAVTDADARRSQPYGERAAAQRAHLGLPLLPTTTIGSFPQTAELRTARADLRAGRIDARRVRGAHQGRDPAR